MSEVIQIMISFVGSLVFLIITGLASLVMFYKAYQYHNKRVFIRNTPTSKIRSMAVGPVKLKGKAKKIDGEDLIDHPVLDRKCLAYRITEKSGNTNKSGGIEKDACNFKIKDETGEVRVYTDEDNGSDSDSGLYDTTVKLQTKKHGINEDREGDEFMWVNVRKHVSAIFPDSELLVIGEAEIDDRDDNYSSSNEDNLCIKRTKEYPLYISNCTNEDELIEEVIGHRYHGLLLGGFAFGFFSLLLSMVVIYTALVLFYILAYG